MTNNTDRPMTHAERLALYSQAKPEIVPPAGPVRRLAPRPRRHSVKHRSIR